MPLRVRRVVTGHDKSGRAIVLSDEVSTDILSLRQGATACNIWTTEAFPVDNTGTGDLGRRPVGTTLPNGTVFRVIEFAPGVAPRVHRTDSIDYLIVLSGEIDMELDDTAVHLKAGDVLVQRGTVHNWINRGTVPCVAAVVLVDAQPVKVGDKVLAAFG